MEWNDARLWLVYTIHFHFEDMIWNFTNQPTILYEENVKDETVTHTVTWWWNDGKIIHNSSHGLKNIHNVHLGECKATFNCCWSQIDFEKFSNVETFLSLHWGRKKWNAWVTQWTQALHRLPGPRGWNSLYHSRFMWNGL